MKKSINIFHNIITTTLKSFLIEMICFFDFLNNKVIERADF